VNARARALCGGGRVFEAALWAAAVAAAEGGGGSAPRCTRLPVRLPLTRRAAFHGVRRARDVDQASWCARAGAGAGADAALPPFPSRPSHAPPPLQVALWTSVMLGAVLASVLWFMLSTAEDNRDPAIFTQMLVDPRSAGKQAGGGGGGSGGSSNAAAGASAAR